MEQLYGLETVRNAAGQLKSLYGGKGKMKLKLFISVKGLKLFDYQTLVSQCVILVYMIYAEILNDCHIESVCSSENFQCVFLHPGSKEQKDICFY